MKIFFISLLTLTVVAVVTSCSNGQVNNSVADLSPIAFSEKLKQLPLASLIDVRTPEEFLKGHLQNAKNIDWNGDDFEKQIFKFNKEEPIFVYCLSGGRSSSAAAIMRSNGFKQVYELDGGISAWCNEGLPETITTSLKNAGMNKQQFDILLNTDKLVLIDFYAPWCAPCKKMEPYLNELKTEWKDKVTIVRINADDNKLLFKALKPGALPALLLYDNQKLIWSNSGYINKEEIAKHFK